MRWWTRGPRPLVALALAIGSVGTVSALDVPFLSGRVNDYAGMLSAAAATRLEARLERFESATGTQIAVLTMDTLAGEALEEYSLRVAETWGLGREGADDGVLFLVVRDDRTMRIEVGYGLEAQLTDAESGRILRNEVRPRFQRGDFDGGIESGVETIIGSLEGVEVPGAAGKTQAPLGVRLGIFAFFLAVTGVFALSAVFSSGCNSWFLYLFLMPFYAVFPTALVHPRAGMIMLGGWIVGFPILKLVLSRTELGRRWAKRHPGWSSWTSGSGSGGGFSGGGFSGGGFSGGGGSFGGGGASSSW